jgi:hypothetical protein
MLLLLLLNLMLPDITSNTWAKKLFETKHTIYKIASWCRRGTGVLITALIAAAADRATAGSAAGGAIAKLVEAVTAGGAGRAVPVAMVAGFATSCTATVSAASEVR